MEQIGHWIDGKRRGRAPRGAPPDVMNPATGEVQAQVALASGSEMEAAVASAAPGAESLGRHPTRKSGRAC